MNKIRPFICPGFRTSYHYAFYLEHTYLTCLTEVALDLVRFCPVLCLNCGLEVVFPKRNICIFLDKCKTLIFIYKSILNSILFIKKSSMKCILLATSLF